MRTRYSLIVWGFVLNLTLVNIAWAESISFDDLPRLVQQQNLAVQGSHAFAAGAKARTGHLPRSFLPKVKAHGGGETFRTLDRDRMTQPVAGVEGNINLLEGGRDYLEEKRRKKELSVKDTQAQKYYLSELRRARNLFVKALFLKDIAGHYRNALANNRQNIELVQKRIDAGLTTETDKLDFAIYQGRLRQELAIVKEDHEHTLELLQSVLGMPLDQEIKLKGSLAHKHTDDLFNADFDPDAHYEVQLLRRQSEALDLAKKKANLWWTPSVDIYGNYNLYPFRERERTAIEERDEYVAGAQLSMNLFDGLQSSREAKSLKFRAKGVKLQSEQKKRELEAQFRKLKHILTLRHDLVHGVQSNVQQTKKYLELTRQEYELGTKNSPDVLSASQRILDQKRRYSEIRRDFLLTKNELVAFLGR